MNRDKSLSFWVLPAQLCLVLLLVTACARQIKKTANTSDFCLPDLTGQEVCLEDYRGKIVLTSFWASWCEPCLSELPQLQDLWTEYKDRGVVLISVNLDTADRESEVRQLARRYRFRFPVLLDQSAEVTNRFHPTLELPLTIVFDRQGRIIARHQGYKLGDERKLDRVIVDRLAI